MSIDNIVYDNKSNIVTISLENPDIHGNIDGGHTLRAILEAQTNDNVYLDDRYVFMELFTGLSSPVELAAARNTSIQVDLKSIEELRNSFEPIKDALKEADFSERIAYKMNEHNDRKETLIDLREIIIILNMFNQDLYQIKNNNETANDAQPIQSYTGKEIGLKKFLNLKKDNPNKINEIIENMKPVILDIFKLWDTIECEFPEMSKTAKKKYGSKKYSKFNAEKPIGKSLFSQNELKYLVPKGILYPTVGAFRALIGIDKQSQKYFWKIDPFEAWKKTGTKLVTIILEEKEDNPEYLGKSANLWSNLFKEILIYSYNNK